MRILYLIALLLLLGAAVVFALENREPMTLEFFNQSISCPRSLMIAIVYLLGMVSGWIVVGLVRHSLRRAAQSP